MTRAVVLSRRLVLERALAAPDGAGGFAQSWESLGDVWARVQAVSGRAQDGGVMTVAAARYKITVRAAPVGADARPTVACRFRDGDRVFAIEAITESDADGRYLMCQTVEEVAS